MEDPDTPKVINRTPREGPCPPKLDVCKLGKKRSDPKPKYGKACFPSKCPDIEGISRCKDVEPCCPPGTTKDCTKEALKEPEEPPKLLTAKDLCPKVEEEEKEACKNFK